MKITGFESLPPSILTFVKKDEYLYYFLKEKTKVHKIPVKEISAITKNSFSSVCKIFHEHETFRSN